MVQGGNGLPALLPDARIGLGTLGELTAEVDQSPEGSDQVSFMTYVMDKFPIKTTDGALAFAWDTVDRLPSASPTTQL
jgi:hypothetical protein